MNNFITNTLLNGNTYIKAVLSVSFPVLNFLFRDSTTYNDNFFIVAMFTWIAIMIPTIIYVVARKSAGMETQVASLVIYMIGLNRVVSELTNSSIDLILLCSGVVLLIAGAVLHKKSLVKANKIEQVITLGSSFVFIAYTVFFV